MGRVFSYEQIQEGKVPDPFVFTKVRKTFALSVGHGVRNETLVGGMVFGSAAVGRANRRSDLDVLLELPDDDIESYESASRVVRALKKATDGKVPVNAIVRSTESLLSGHHEMDRFFGAHLSGPHRTVVGEDPAKSLHLEFAPAHTIIDDYIHSKMRKISQGFVTDDETKKLEHMQRLLDLPLAIGRKVVRAVDEVEGTHRLTDDTANKSSVREAAMDLFEEHGISEVPSMLIDLNAVYDHVLDYALSGDINHRTYDDFLRDVASRAPAVMEWLRMVDREIGDRLGATRN